jgi:hypothetical protein
MKRETWEEICAIAIPAVALAILLLLRKYGY